MENMERAVAYDSYLEYGKGTPEAVWKEMLPLLRERPRTKSQLLSGIKGYSEDLVLWVAEKAVAYDVLAYDGKVYSLR